MKEFEKSTIDFNMQSRSYAKVTKVSMKMKSSASPCPLDQISVIAFKKCPALRSRLANILQRAWSAKTFPDDWKSGATVLAYKKMTLDILKTFIQSPYNLCYRKYLLPSLETDFSTSLQKTNTLRRIFKKVFGKKYRVVLNALKVYRIS